MLDDSGISVQGGLGFRTAANLPVTHKRITWKTGQVCPPLRVRAYCPIFVFFYIVLSKEMKRCVRDERCQNRTSLPASVTAFIKSSEGFLSVMTASRSLNSVSLWKNDVPNFEESHRSTVFLAFDIMCLLILFCEMSAS